MRVGTFLLGGIAGAAAVIYLNRKAKSMMFAAFNSSNTAMGKMMNKSQNTSSNQAKTAGSTSQASQSGQSAGKGSSFLQQSAEDTASNADGKSARMH